MLFRSGIFGIVTLCIIIAPLPNLLKGGVSFDFNTAVSAPERDMNYIYAVYKNKVAVMERGLTGYLSDNGYGNTSVSISVDTYTENMRITAVYINLKGAVISAEKQHIDKYAEVTRLAAAYLNAPKEVMILSG